MQISYKTYMKKRVLLILFFLISISLVYAHQPRIVFDKQSSSDNPFLVDDPEVSKAFYGDLNGTSDYYLIVSNQSFDLYLGILSPDITPSEKDFSVKVIGPQNISLDGTLMKWTPFFEDFAGDSYWQGPEFDKKADQGKYLIQVSSPDNHGKYVLAVGKKEEFPPKEAFNAVFSLPKLKKEFFEKPMFTAFFNILGIYFLFFIFLAIFVLIALIKLIQFVFRPKKYKI